METLFAFFKLELDTSVTSLIIWEHSSATQLVVRVQLVKAIIRNFVRRNINFETTIWSLTIRTRPNQCRNMNSLFYLARSLAALKTREHVAILLTYKLF